jgi:hypothetical protein
MKIGQTVKHKFSGRIMTIKTVDEFGINLTEGHYEAFTENIRTLSLWEKIKLFFYLN